MNHCCCCCCSGHWFGSYVSPAKKLKNEISRLTFESSFCFTVDRTDNGDERLPIGIDGNVIADGRSVQRENSEQIGLFVVVETRFIRETHSFDEQREAVQSEMIHFARRRSDVE